MNSLPPLPTRRRRLNPTLRAAGAAGLVGALLLSLVACKEDDAAPLTPAAAALVASAPAVSAKRVPPPPLIPAGDTSAAAPAAGDLASVDSKLEATLASAAACSVDTECHSVAVGAKACGGPTGYRAYSDKTVSQANVDSLAQQERDLAAAAARASHQVSPCFMLADPGAHCQQNKCVTGRPGTP